MSVLTRPADVTEPLPEVAAPPASTNGATAEAAGRIAAPPRDSMSLRLAAFAALGLFGASQWAGLVADPPTGRALLMVAIASGGALALARLRGLPARRRLPLAAGVLLLVFALGFLAAGLRLRLLMPGNWDELADGVDRGLSGIRTVNWPYDGTEEWVRQTILLGAPLLLGLAAALAFWPGRRGASLLRGAGLVCLLVLYGTAVTEHDPGRPVLRGLLLLFLVAAWLWLPRMAPREAATGAALVAAVGICAIPLSVRFDADQPWWDYRAWNWFGGGKVVSFDWRHSYGPLDWPRDGTTLLNIKSRRPHYWKAETLETFDGLRWMRLGTRTTYDEGQRGFGELPSTSEPDGPTWDYFEYNPSWDEHMRVTVRALRSDLIVGAGTTYQVFGAGRTDTAADGTTFKRDEPLEKGDVYTVRAYTPDPTAAQMRGAPAEYGDSMRFYTSVLLPRRGQTARNQRLRGFPNPAGPRRLRLVPPALWGDPEGVPPAAERALAASPYAEVYRLARELTADARTPYDAVLAIQNHLRARGNYRYNERPPTRDYPLAAFLFEDKIGYCQQFSGAMALMLRMVGIPARVATGFTRGSFNRDTGEHRVRDLDAHSWVEVNFTGIGWVTFDPTPAATPAEGQAPNFGAAAAALTGADEQARNQPGASDRTGDPDAAAGASGGGVDWRLLPVLAVLLLVAGAGALALRRAARHRTLSPDARSEAQLGELHDALVRLGWRLPEGTTLLVLERRLRRMAGVASARYAAALRAHRYDPAGPAPPGLPQRRALRRELAAPTGLRGRLRALVALPPGGPRRR